MEVAPRKAVVFRKVATWWTPSRYAFSAPVSISAQQCNTCKRNGAGGEIEKEIFTVGSTIRFVYGDQPYACLKFDDCPMRFENKEMQVMHYIREHGGGQLRYHYTCMSCFKADRIVGFTSRDSFLEHKMNPKMTPKYSQRHHLAMR